MSSASMLNPAELLSYDEVSLKSLAKQTRLRCGKPRNPSAARGATAPRSRPLNRRIPTAPSRGSNVVRAAICFTKSLAQGRANVVWLLLATTPLGLESPNACSDFVSALPITGRRNRDRRAEPHRVQCRKCLTAFVIAAKDTSSVS